MSLFSDWECGAISDEEFRNFGIVMNRREQYEYEHEHEEVEDEIDDSEEDG